MKSMLCVVDMQWPFLQAEDSCYVSEVVQAVRQARSLGEHILIVEDQRGHPTHEAITDELEGYPHVSYLRKAQWDGSLQIAIELSDRLKTVPESITACGAFAEQCVMATLAGLRQRFPAIELKLLLKASVPAPATRFSSRDWLACSQRLCLSLS